MHGKDCVEAVESYKSNMADIIDEKDAEIHRLRNQLAMLLENKKENREH